MNNLFFPVYGNSPSFVIQEFGDPDETINENNPSHYRQINTTNNLQQYNALYDNQNNCIPSVNSYNIRDISYASDGETLEGTIWLDKPLKSISNRLNESLQSLQWIDIYYLKNQTDKGAFKSNINKTIEDIKPVIQITKNLTEIKFGNNQVGYLIAYNSPNDTISNYISIFTITNDNIGYAFTYHASKELFNQTNFEDKTKEIINFMKFDNRTKQIKNSTTKIEIPYNWKSDYKQINFHPLDNHDKDNSTTLLLHNMTLTPNNNISQGEYYMAFKGILDNNNISKIKIINESRFYLKIMGKKNYPANMIEYTDRSLGKTYHSLDVLFKDNKSGYLFHFSTEESKFNKYSPVIEKIFRSISIKDSYFRNNFNNFQFEAPIKWIDHQVQNPDKISKYFNKSLKKIFNSIFISSFRTPIKDIPDKDPVWQQLEFSMQLGIPSAYGTNPTYLSMSEWNNTQLIWNNKLSLMPSSIDSDTEKVLNNSNANISIKPGLKYIDFKLDLKPLNYPKKFTLLFQMQHEYLKNGFMCKFGDVTNTALVPPPKFNINASTSSINLKRGDVKNITIIQSSDTLPSYRTEFTSEENIPGLKLKFTPSSINVPPSGIAISNLILNASENAKIGTSDLLVKLKNTFNETVGDYKTNKTINSISIKPITIPYPITINIGYPEFNITASPSSINLRPGESGDIKIVIKSLTNLKSSVTLNVNKQEDIETEILPKTTVLLPNGIAASNLHIAIPNTHTNVAPYVIPIDVNISVNNTPINEPPYQITLNAIRPFNLDENIQNFSNWLSPITSIWTFIIAIATTMISIFIRFYSKKKDKRKDNKFDDFI